MLIQGTVKTIVPRCWRWLGNCCLRPNIAMLFVQICDNYTSEGGCAKVMGNNWLVPRFQHWRTMITLNISKLRSSRNLSLSYDNIYDIVVKIYIYIQQMYIHLATHFYILHHSIFIWIKYHLLYQIPHNSLVLLNRMKCINE